MKLPGRRGKTMIRYLMYLGALAAAGTSHAQTVTTMVGGIEASGDVSFGPDGRLYVADFGESLASAGGANIYRIDPETGAIEILSDAFGGASGNEFGADGALYQSDVGRGEVHRVAMDGTRTRLAEGLTTPVGVAPAGDGTVYVVECMANAITRIGPGGATERIAEGTPLACPNGLSLAPDGNLYTVNFRGGAMVRIALPAGEASVVATLPGGGNGHLAWANDRFYVASFRGHRIYSVTMAGEICLIAGSGEAGNQDGDALAASFFRPNGVAVSADGDTLYTNTITAMLEPQDPALHPNAVRRVDGLLALLDCPEDRRVTGG
jgi:sugar lactone lactonase YvrE